MSYRATIENVVSYLMRDNNQLSEYQEQIKVLELLRDITEGNVKGIDFALVKFITNIYNIKIGVDDSTVNMDRETAERLVEVSIPNLIYEKEFRLKEELSEQGLTFDLSIPKDADEAVTYFYDEMVTSIQNVYEKEITSVQARVELGMLRDQIVDTLFRTSAMIQSETYQTKGLKHSIEKAREYLNKIDYLNGIAVDNTISSQEVIRLVDYKTAMEFDTKNKGLIKPLFRCGIQPYDEKFSFMNDDIVVTVAGINVGKTRFCIFEAYRCLMSGVNCTILCTETPKEKMKRNLELMHMFYLYGHRELTSQKLLEIELMEPGEERDRYQGILDQFESCKADLYSNPKYGKVSIANNCSYEECYEFFRKEKQVHGSECIFIDHVRDLSHRGKTPDGRMLRDEKESLAYLAGVMKEIRKTYKVMFFVFSHPNSSMSRETSDDKLGLSTNLTAGATEISESATRMFYLSQTFDQSQNDFVCIRETKSREEEKITKSFVLSRMGSSNVHIFDERLQTSGNEDLEEYDDLVM